MLEVTVSPMQNCQSLVQGRGMGWREAERSVAKEKLKVLKVEYEIYKLGIENTVVASQF